jgi:hypothetical protein
MTKFHVILRERKAVGVKAQLKYGRALVIEGPPEHGATYFRLAKEWNDAGRTMTTEAELAKLKTEAFASTPAYQGELFAEQSPPADIAGATEATEANENEDRRNQPA